MLECVLNLSEGTRLDVVARLAAAAGTDLLDVHADAHHNRAVLTLVGEDSPRAVTRAAVEELDLRTHRGVHPRIGVVDVVPFVPLGAATLAEAEAAADRYARWAGTELALPCFRYGTRRTLPEVRRGAFVAFAPDWGPVDPASHRGSGGGGGPTGAGGLQPVAAATRTWIGPAPSPGSCADRRCGRSAWPWATRSRCR